MVPHSLNTSSLWDADSYWHNGNCPWTFFAYPRSVADECGLPPDDDANRLLAELMQRGIRVGVWRDAVPEHTSYFACPKEDIQLLDEALAELEQCGLLKPNFCTEHSERLFASGT